MVIENIAKSISIEDLNDTSGLNKEVSKIIHSVVAELNLNKGFLPKN